MNIEIVKHNLFIDGKHIRRSRKYSCTRDAYLHKGYIIKLDDHLHQSTAELLKWDDIKRSDRKHFIEPVDGRFSNVGIRGWIMQKFEKLNYDIEPENHKDFIDYMRKRYAIEDLKYGDNMGYDVKGNLRIFDWGVNDK